MSAGPVGARQRILKKIKKFSARRHSAKNLKKLKKILCRVPAQLALGKAVVSAFCFVMATFLCRVLSWRSAKPLPRARQKALGKEAFADKNFVMRSLSSAALGKVGVSCSVLITIKRM
jgi:hypothetical protein